MNDNKLSTNLSTIDTAVSRMRASLGASNLDINKLADKVAEVKASLDGLESNMVYEVASRAAMSALSGIQDGSACIVKGAETRGIKKWDKFVTINFPDRVVLNAPLAADEVINIGIKIKGTGHGTLTGSLTATSFIFGVIIKGQGASAKSITYTAQGNTYVRTDSYGSPITAAGELQWDDSYAFDDRLSQFFVADILLEETNIYYKNSWVPVNAGETLELKMTTTEQAATILEQTVTNNRLNADLAAANTTIQQQELTITAQENTITLKDAEIAALNARIEELEREQEPEEPEEPEEPALMSRQLNPVVNTNSTDIITIENASYLYDETKCYLHVDCVVSQDYPDNTSLIYNLPLCNGEIWLNVNTDDITGEMTLLDNGDIRYSVDKLIFRNLNSFQRDGIENGDPNVELESIVGNKEVNGMNNLVSENMTNLEILDYQLYQNASNEYCMNIHITNHSPDVRYALYIDDEYAAEVAPNATKYIWHVLGPNMLVGDITCTEGINED